MRMITSTGMRVERFFMGLFFGGLRGGVLLIVRKVYGADVDTASEN